MPGHTTVDESFGAFAAAALPELLRFGHLLTGDRATAEDLVQTALLKTMHAWRRVRDKEQPHAYVRRVMVNTHVTWWRSWTSRVRLGDVEDRQSLHDAGADADERDAMARALRGLPPRQRAVLVLRYYGDLSEEQIAEVLGCSRGTVKSQASRALATLRARLSEDGMPAASRGARHVQR